ncbi:SDR family NAD(P)-dependent oxidoreductase [Agrobacterium sp. V1]|uniref:SDR family NAD(P)-dependent oxidoreductase n=1 Tax=Agrobacterium sp. V1 TaxID=3061957 RepID=UPI002671A0EE|nr:SDR family NAD(P)-dependent oxidoreductase [Agrobacterium sp. V1]MDO3445495.1 SDR family NAD(P)-dependent oxidoreductase [Agrobacterium sp. V1]
MTNHQKPLPSGFGADSSTADVLSNIDLSGKQVIVTGGHSGLGLETTRALSKAGAVVTVASRNPNEALVATNTIPGVIVEALDLSDLKSVDAFAEKILDQGRHIDILINNAGVMASPEMRVGLGWEMQFATNHLGHFALTNRLWPVLSGGARVISVSSAGHHFSPIRWDDLHFVSGYDKWIAYGQSKTANALFAVELDRLGRKDDVRAFSLHPGSIATPLQRHLTVEEMVAAGWIDADGNPLIPLKSTEQGAATAVWVATTPRLEGLGGLYCEDCDVAIRADDGTPPLTGVKYHAVDEKEAERLWEVSVELTGTNAFERQ